MKTVYVVTEGTYSDYGIEALFSTEEKAKAFVAKHEYNSDRRVEEYTLDEWIDAGTRTVWTTVIDVTNGEIQHYEQCTRFTPHPRWTETNECYFDFRRDGPGPNRPLTGITARSTVSQEHADKIAIEARQKKLREGTNSLCRCVACNAARQDRRLPPHAAPYPGTVQYPCGNVSERIDQ